MTAASSGAEPAAEEAAGRREQQRHGEEEGRGERAHERPDEPPVQLAAAGVEGEVLGHARGAAVLEAELVAEVGRDAGVAPRLDRDGVLLDQADRRDGGGRAEDRPREPAQLRAAEHERAAEQVRGHGRERVPRGQEDRVRARLAVQQVLRDQRVEDDEPAEREREQVDEPRPERQRAGAHRVERDAAERRRQQQLLPGLDHVEREARDAGAVEQRHDEVVEREPDDERVEREHRPAPDGDEPDGQGGQVDEQRERRGHQARPRRRNTSVANRYGASGPVSRATTRRPAWRRPRADSSSVTPCAAEGGGAVGAATGQRERRGPGSAPGAGHEAAVENGQLHERLAVRREDAAELADVPEHVAHAREVLEHEVTDERVDALVPDALEPLTGDRAELDRRERHGLARAGDHRRRDVEAEDAVEPLRERGGHPAGPAPHLHREAAARIGAEPAEERIELLPPARGIADVRGGVAGCERVPCRAHVALHGR